MSDRFLPPKPNFGSHEGDSLIPKSEFDKWYDKEIRPLFEDAQLVFGSDKDLYWGPIKEYHDTHVGLLINIQSVKEATAEDLLRDFYKLIEKSKLQSNLDGFLKLANQAKYLLEVKEKK